MTTINTIPEATAAFKALRGFISPAQITIMAQVCRSEEKQFMFDKLAEIMDTIATMPKTYQTDGQGDAAVVFLHYFVKNCDFYITERDMETEQHQAFGLADLGYGAELGYISINEIISAGAELDLHWTPQTLQQIKYKKEVDRALNDFNSTSATMHY